MGLEERRSKRREGKEGARSKRKVRSEGNKETICFLFHCFIKFHDDKISKLINIAIFTATNTCR